MAVKIGAATGAADARPGPCDRERSALSPVASLARWQPAPDDRATPFGRTGGSAGFMGQKWDSDIAGSAAARHPGADRSTSRAKPQHRPAPGSATRALPLRRPASCISLLIALATPPGRVNHNSTRRYWAGARRGRLRDLTRQHDEKDFKSILGTARPW